MPHTVRIQGDSAVFPGNACVHCLRQAVDRVELVKVKGSAVRKVSVPFCDECTVLRQTRSPAQVRFERVARMVSFLLAWAAGMWAYIVLSRSGIELEHAWVWALLVAVLIVAAVFGLFDLAIKPWSHRFRSAETKAALDAVKITVFDWDTTTLEFADREYAERFERVNQGPGPPAEGCSCFDRTDENNDPGQDGDVDQDDFAAFVDCVAGPEIPWSLGLTPSCIP